MSQQLTISSLFSALALVSLCLALAVGEQFGSAPVAPQVLVQAETVPGLPS